MNKEVFSIIQILKNSGIAVIPTDTIYGLIARAHDTIAVQKVSTLKNRRAKSPFLILINDIDQICDFDIALTKEQRRILRMLWGGNSLHCKKYLQQQAVEIDDLKRSISVVIPCFSDKKIHLHQGRKSIGFRLLKKDGINVHVDILRKIIDHVGPVIATSVNISGQPFATSITQAKEYFGDQCGFYMRKKNDLNEEPSVVIALDGGVCTVLRK